MCVRECVCMFVGHVLVQPQHPDEVSLIGSLWDSSASFHSDPAHCQQSDLTEPESKTKDGTCYFLPSASTQTHNHQSSKWVCQLLTDRQAVIIISTWRNVYALFYLLRQIATVAAVFSLWHKQGQGQLLNKLLDAEMFRWQVRLWEVVRLSYQCSNGTK